MVGEIEMKLGIMQPYFFPYIGYWQLMAAVDQYVMYDDVNYINRGWINRNRILINGDAKYITLPCTGASQNKLINEVKVCTDIGEQKRNMRKVELAYRRAPYFESVYPMLCDVFSSKIENLADFLEYCIRSVCAYLEIHTVLLRSSSLKKDPALRGQNKILAINAELGATEYINAIGGKELYSDKAFSERGIQLHFLKTDEIAYRQFDGVFLPNLSIIDVMMFNPKEEIQAMLNRYTLT